jgi:hypothetical protein
MSKKRTLLMIVDYGDGAELDDRGTEQLAQVHRDMAYGSADVTLHKVLVLDDAATPPALIKAKYRVTGADRYDENGFSHRSVEVTFPDGTIEICGYTVDGNA